MQSIWSNIEHFPLEIQLITEEIIGYIHNSGFYVGLSDIIVYFDTKKGCPLLSVAGGFHLYLFEFAFINQFYSRTGSLFQQSVAND